MALTDLLPPLENTDKIKEAFDIIAAESVARIDEDTFKNVFLPILGNVSGSIDINPWLMVAGCTFREVAVFKDNVELFRVPPIHRTVKTNITRRQGESVRDVLQMAHLEGQLHPNRGVAAMSNGLSNFVSQHTMDTSVLKQWNAILQRYGYPEISELIPNDTVLGSKGALESDLGKAFTDDFENF